MHYSTLLLWTAVKIRLWLNLRLDYLITALSDAITVVYHLEKMWWCTIFNSNKLISILFTVGKRNQNKHLNSIDVKEHDRCFAFSIRVSKLRAGIRTGTFPTGPISVNQRAHQPKEKKLRDWLGGSEVFFFKQLFSFRSKVCFQWPTVCVCVWVWVCESVSVGEWVSMWVCECGRHHYDWQNNKNEKIGDFFGAKRSSSLPPPPKKKRVTFHPEILNLTCKAKKGDKKDLIFWHFPILGPIQQTLVKIFCFGFHPIRADLTDKRCTTATWGKYQHASKWQYRAIFCSIYAL